MGRWADGPGRPVLGAEFWGSCFGGCIVKRCEVGVTGPQRVGGSPDIEIPKRLRIIQSLRGSCNPSSTGFGDPCPSSPSKLSYHPEERLSLYCKVPSEGDECVKPKIVTGKASRKTLLQ